MRCPATGAKRACAFPDIPTLAKDAESGACAWSASSRWNTSIVDRTDGRAPRRVCDTLAFFALGGIDGKNAIVPRGNRIVRALGLASTTACALVFYNHVRHCSCLSLFCGLASRSAVSARNAPENQRLGQGRPCVITLTVESAHDFTGTI